MALARATGEAMGKRVIVAADGPGFLVNRCGRPFGAEALRLVQESVATPEQVDRICRLGGGFRMGPFELMDLVGIDVATRWRSRSPSCRSASRAGSRARCRRGWCRRAGWAASPVAAGTSTATGRTGPTTQPPL